MHGQWVPIAFNTVHSCSKEMYLSIKIPNLHWLQSDWSSFTNSKTQHTLGLFKMFRGPIDIFESIQPAFLVKPCSNLEHVHRNTWKILTRKAVSFGGFCDLFQILMIKYDPVGVSWPWPWPMVEANQIMVLHGSYECGWKKWNDTFLDAWAYFVLSVSCTFWGFFYIETFLWLRIDRDSVFDLPLHPPLCMLQDPKSKISRHCQWRENVVSVTGDVLDIKGASSNTYKYLILN